MTGIKRVMHTSVNLVKGYGVEGFVKGVLNKLQGRDLLHGVEPKQHGIKDAAEGGSHDLLQDIAPEEEPEAEVTAEAAAEEADAEEVCCTVEVQEPTLFDAVNCLTAPRVYPAEQRYSCTVLVPIYNGLEHLKRLFPSLAVNTPDDIEILLVDDCSPDPEIGPFIQQYLKQYSRWKSIRNDRNLGFLQTVNNGMEKVGTDYVILLNTDTEVPHDWIPKMITPLMENSRIATTTPFTNCGVIFSYPRFGVDQSPKGDLEEINRAFDHVVSTEYALNEVYSGTGYCMGINMACWKEIGPLDYEHFGKGYGEENDWCFRALQKGWRHLLVPNLYVHHHHGGSFLSEEKQRLCDEHQQLLKEMYPQYMNETVPAFVRQDPWKVYRYAAAIQQAKDNCIIYINIKPADTDVSGAIDYGHKELTELQQASAHVIVAQYVRCTARWSIVPVSVDASLEIPMDDVADLELLFDHLNATQVIVNNLAYCENVEKALSVLVRLKKTHAFQLSYKFHDYLSVCPSFFLISKEGKPCDPKNPDNCKDCIRGSRFRAVQRDNIARWRMAFSAFFDVVDQCLFFSNYTRDMVGPIYPQVKNKATVKYHEPLFCGNESRYERPAYEEQWNFAFVGNFCIEKGSSYFVGMRDALRQRGVNAAFTIIGENHSEEDVTDIPVLGRYRREDLGRLLTEHNIHAVLYSSICNESFSYVAQELMILNVPLVVFPCGAPQERIRAEKYPYGAVAEDVTVDALMDATNELLNKVYHAPLMDQQTVSNKGQ